MFERFTRESRQVLVRAEAEAARHGEGYLGTEHLLLGLLDDEGIGVMLQYTGTDPERLRTAMRDATQPSPTPTSQRPAFNARAKEVLELSLREALDVHDRLIRPRHILLGLLREADEPAAKALALAGVTPERVRAFGEVRENVAGRMRGYRERVRDIWDFRTAGATAAASTGATRIPLLARELAGGGRVSTMHYLRALLAEGNGLAARVLTQLGVTLEKVDAKAEELGAEGTSDEHPDDRRSRQVRIKLGTGPEITIEDEDVARQLQELASEGEDAIRDALRKLTED